VGRSDQVDVTAHGATSVRLLRLTIENVGLIARAELDFAERLTVVTGETGSGKTMLLGGLALALGGRVDGDTIRTGAERARATLEIAPDDALRARLAAAGFVLEPDDDLIVGREVLASGRSTGRINGIPASAGQLRDLIGTLVDVVSQHEAQGLLAPAFALDLVDRVGGAETLALREEVRRLYEDLRAARERAAALRDTDGRKLARAEFARFALGEIDARAIEGDDEDERLRERRDLLINAERVLASLATARAALEDDGAAVDALGSAETALLGLARYSERFAELASSAAALQSDANELAARIARERDAVELDPAELDAIGERLDALDSLKKKYGGSLAAVRAQRDAFVAEIGDVDDRDARVAAAEREVEALVVALRDRAAALGAHRAAAAAAIEAAVGAELTALAMPAARLRIALEPLEAVGAGGAERAELRFAANPGEPERPLVRIASGGELSRVLLALVVVLADRRERTALIFDEIDAGIGGATAAAVGARLARLAEDAQVVCVTHLAQIAAYGDTHVALRKHVRGAVTAIDAVALSGEPRRVEVARMLSGDELGVALEHAAELLAARGR
jgi:DNA repair protein RecN (Recombination protein N)